MSHASGRIEIIGKTAGQVFMRYRQSLIPTTPGNSWYSAAIRWHGGLMITVIS